MNRLPSLPVLIVVALTATVVAVGAQEMIGKSTLTIAIGPITAIVLALLVTYSNGTRPPANGPLAPRRLSPHRAASRPGPHSRQRTCVEPLSLASLMVSRISEMATGRLTVPCRLIRPAACCHERFQSVSTGRCSCHFIAVSQLAGAAAEPNIIYLGARRSVQL